MMKNLPARLRSSYFLFSLYKPALRFYKCNKCTVFIKKADTKLYNNFVFDFFIFVFGIISYFFMAVTSLI